jgi:DnaJ-class molecular chaperone
MLVVEMLTLAGAVWVVGYVIACAVWPYRRCSRCGGTGKHRSPSGKAWRPCGRCKGAGHRVRAGRRVVEWWR